MTLSVVIPAYNAERFVGEAIESVLSQSRLPDELFVIDDGVTDRRSIPREDGWANPPARHRESGQ